MEKHANLTQENRVDLPVPEWLRTKIKEEKPARQPYWAYLNELMEGEA